jgi:hypothetical protein
MGGMSLAERVAEKRQTARIDPANKNRLFIGLLSEHPWRRSFKFFSIEPLQKMKILFKATTGA